MESPFGDYPAQGEVPFGGNPSGRSRKEGISDKLDAGGDTMEKLSKKDELLERIGIEMDHIKARVLELKAQARKLGLEARLDLEKRLGSFEKTQEELKAHLADWAKAGESRYVCAASVNNVMEAHDSRDFLRIMDEADLVSDWINIIDHGKIIASGTSLELKTALGRDMIYLETSDDEAALRLLRTLEMVGEANRSTRGLAVTITTDGAHCLPIIISRLRDEGINVISVNLKRPTLDDVFVYYTGRELRDAAAGAERMTTRMFVRGGR